METIEISNIDILQSRCIALMKLCSSLKEFCDNKNRILSRLQQPFTSDGLHVGSDYKLQFVTLMNEIINSLTGLSDQVQLIQWSKSPNIDISKMVILIVKNNNAGINFESDSNSIRKISEISRNINYTQKVS